LASVGIVLPDLATSQFAAAAPAGELKVAFLPSSLRNLPPDWGQRLVVLVVRHRLVVAPDSLGLVRQLLRGGLLVLPRPASCRNRHAGRVEEGIVVEENDVGERLGEAILLAAVGECVQQGLLVLG